VTGLAAVLGPVLGGAVTQGLGWRWIFWINVPIALAAVPLVLGRLQEARSPGGAADLGGLVLVTGAALGLVWGLVRGNDAGWGSAETVGTLAAGTVAVIAFAAWQRRAKAPMLPPRLFASRAFTAGNATIFLLNGSLSAAVFLMPQFQQVVLGQHPLSAGLRLLPWGIPPFLLAPRAGALADRIGERFLAACGLALQAAGLAWIAAIASPSISYAALVTPMTIVGVGFAIAIPAVTRAATSNTRRPTSAGPPAPTPPCASSAARSASPSPAPPSPLRAATAPRRRSATGSPPPAQSAQRWRWPASRPRQHCPAGETARLRRCSPRPRPT
jgi:MFS family permease